MNPRLPNTLRAVAAVTLLSLTPQLALAQAAPAAQQAPITPAHNQVLDLVRLTNGTQYQGVLGEVVPGSHVTMLLVTGQVLRFEAAQIAYAGRADGAPLIALTQPSAPVFVAPAPAPAAAPATLNTEPESTPAITQPAPQVAMGPVRDDHTPARDYRESAHRDGTIAGVVMGLGAPLGIGLFAAGLRARATRDDICTVAASDGIDAVCAKERLSTGAKAAIALGPLITTAALGIGTWLLVRRHHTLREHEREALPPAPGEVAQLEPADTRSDAERVAAQRADLLKCLTSSPAQRLEAKLSIGSDGKLKTLEPSRVLPQQEQSCLEHTMGSITFSRGAERKLRLVLAH